MFRNTFLEGHADPTDNFPSPGCVFSHSRRSLTRLSYIGMIARKPSQTGVGIGDRGGNRLVPLVREGGSQLPHRGHSIYVRELRLYLPQPLALFLRSFALGHIDHGTHVFNEIAGWTENGMAYCVDVPDLAAGVNDR